MGDGSQWGRLVQTPEGKKLWIEECVFQEEVRKVKSWKYSTASAYCFRYFDGCDAPTAGSSGDNNVFLSSLWFDLKNMPEILIQKLNWDVSKCPIVKDHEQYFMMIPLPALGGYQEQYWGGDKISDFYKSVAVENKNIVDRFASFFSPQRMIDPSVAALSVLNFGEWGNELCFKFDGQLKEKNLQDFASIDYDNELNVLSRALRSFFDSKKNFTKKAPLDTVQKQKQKLQPQEKISDFFHVANFNVIQANFEDGTKGRFIIFESLDGIKRGVVLRSHEIVSNSFVTKLEDAGFFIKQGGNNVDLLRRELTSYPLQRFVQVVNRPGWNDFGYWSGYISPVVYEGEGQNRSIVTSTCCFRDLCEINFDWVFPLFKSMDAASKPFVKLFMGGVASGLFLNSIPNISVCFHIYGVSEDCANFWAKFVGTLYHPGFENPLAWHFQDFIQHEDIIDFYQDAAIVFESIRHRDLPRFKKFLKSIADSRSDGSDRPFLWTKPGPESEKRTVVISFGQKPIIGKSKIEKQRHTWNVKNKIVLQNYQAPKSFESWYCKHKDECFFLLQNMKQRRGVFLNFVANGLMQSGSDELNSCWLSFIVHLDLAEAGNFALAPSNLVDVVLNTTPLKFIIKKMGLESKMSTPELPLCYQNPSSFIPVQKFLSTQDGLDLFREIDKLRNMIGLKGKERAYREDYAFVIHKGKYCYFDYGRLVLRNGCIKSRQKLLLEMLLKEGVLMPSPRGKNGDSLYVPEGCSPEGKKFGGKTIYGYVFCLKAFTSWVERVS